MTQARTHARARGGIKLLIQLLLEVVLCAFVRLVQGVEATLGMRFNRINRDWHTMDPQEALPQAKPGIQLKDPTPSTASFSGSSRESLLDQTRGFTNDPHQAINRDARHKAEHDTGDAAASNPETILRDDRFAIPQDEGGRLGHRCKQRNLVGLILRGLREAQIVSKDEAGLTALSPLIPTKVGIQGGPKGLSRLAALGLLLSHNRSWMPTFVGMSGTS